MAVVLAVLAIVGALLALVVLYLITPRACPECGERAAGSVAIHAGGDDDEDDDDDDDDEDDEGRDDEDAGDAANDVAHRRAGEETPSHSMRGG